jgi:hypothetical protein
MTIAILSEIPIVVRDCDSSEFLFLGKCFCKPGFERETKESKTCGKPLLKNGDCDCESDNLTDRDKILLNPKWIHNKGYRCTALCRYNSEVGVITSIKQEWNENQKWRQLSFYKKELTQTSKERNKRTHMRIRLDEFGSGFHEFQSLNNINLGNVIEFGCGGYTQIRNILERTNINTTMDTITLVDPQIDDYKKIDASSYYSGNLKIPAIPPVTNDSSGSRSGSGYGSVEGIPQRTYPTKLSNLTVEEYGKINKNEYNKYDTVIMMNVLVYAQNAIDFLNTLHKTLKLGGILIFHDRWFSDSVSSSHCKTAGFAMHIIQVKQNLLKHFFDSSFTKEPLLSTAQTEGQIDRSKNWCKWKDDEMGYWAILRKIK